MALEDRFWKKVSRLAVLNGVRSIDPEECWIWTGALMPNGYGAFYVGRNWRHSRKGTMDYAHRVSWTLKFGSIPNGKSILHSCDNRRCVNPNHLWVGTQKDNVRDMLSKGRFGGGALRGLFGTANPASKLTEDDVRAVRSCYSTGRWGYRRLAEMFGVTPVAIKKIVLRRTWKHVA